MQENETMTNEQMRRFEIYVKLDTLQEIKENTTDPKTIETINQKIKELRNAL